MRHRGEDLFEKRSTAPGATADAAGVGGREGRTGLGAALAGFRLRRDARRRRRYEEGTSEEARSAAVQLRAPGTSGGSGPRSRR